MFLCILNAGALYLDLFYSLLILFKIPNGLILKNNGSIIVYKKSV